MSIEQYRHVNAAKISGVFQFDSQAQCSKIAVKDADVITHIALHLVFAIPVVGNAGVKGMKEVFKTGKVLCC